MNLPEELIPLDREIAAQKITLEKMHQFVRDSATPDSVKSFYLLLQKAILDALDLAYLSNKDSLRKYIGPSATLASDTMKLAAFFLPKEAQLAMQIGQSVLSVLKGTHAVADIVIQQIGYRVPIQEKATRIIISEILAQKFTLEYADILQHVTPASHRTLIESLIERLDLREILTQKKAEFIGLYKELHVQDNIGLINRSFIPERARIAISSDDILVRPIIVHTAHDGTQTFYKPLNLANKNRLSCLGFRRVEDLSLLQDHNKYTAILPLDELLYLHNTQQDRTDFVNSMYLEIMLSESPQRLDQLKLIISENNAKTRTDKIQQYLIEHHGRNVPNLIAPPSISAHQSTLSAVYSTLVSCIGISFDPNSKTFLLEAITERQLVLKSNLSAMHQNEQAVQTSLKRTASDLNTEDSEQPPLMYSANMRMFTPTPEREVESSNPRLQTPKKPKTQHDLHEDNSLQDYLANSK